MLQKYGRPWREAAVTEQPLETHLKDGDWRCSSGCQPDLQQLRLEPRHLQKGRSLLGQPPWCKGGCACVRARVRVHGCGRGGAAV
jgi:hypothetical protein